MKPENAEKKYSGCCRVDAKIGGACIRGAEGCERQEGDGIRWWRDCGGYGTARCNGRHGLEIGWLNKLRRAADDVLVAVLYLLLRYR